MSDLKISVVCCEDSPEQHSRIVETTLPSSQLDDLLLETAEQEVAANEEKGLHNAAHHAQHSPVTYLQQVNEGGFSVLVGDPQNLKDVFFGKGTYVAFIDAEGPGHASKVGPNAVQRTFRMLKGHISV